MFSWRITKYNPCYRNYQGAYLKNEWISYGDIGISFDNTLFTFEDYIKVENMYIEAILLFMYCLEVSYLTFTPMEKYVLDKNDAHFSSSMIRLFNSIRDGIVVNRYTVDDLVRLILRETIWGKLKAQNMYVHFGYDYYMYIGAVHPCLKTIQKIKHMGLFVEKFDSPYHD